MDIAVSVIDKFPVNKAILEDEKLIALAEAVISKAVANSDYSEIDYEISEVVYDLYGISNQEKGIIREYIQERTESI
ncbi:MAG: hypothetical protein PUK34_03880 [Clostridia bacterium]|nr:hypothetical protein [Clostridia bacterium]